jgi:hypothetical protein
LQVGRVSNASHYTYNTKDIDALLQTYAPDAQQFTSLAT